MPVAQTSIEAYSGMLPRLHPLQGMVLDAIRWAGPLSNREIALALDRPEKSITGRTGELAAKGLIRKAGKKKNPNGRNEQTWEVVK